MECTNHEVIPMLNMDAVNDFGEEGPSTTGRWTKEEHELFIRGLQLYNRQWKSIAELVKTRTVVQIRTHAQKYFIKLSKHKSDKPQKTKASSPTNENVFKYGDEDTDSFSGRDEKDNFYSFKSIAHDPSMHELDSDRCQTTYTTTSVHSYTNATIASGQDHNLSNAVLTPHLSYTTTNGTRSVEKIQPLKYNIKANKARSNSTTTPSVTTTMNLANSNTTTSLTTTTAALAVVDMDIHQGQGMDGIDPLAIWEHASSLSQNTMEPLLCWEDDFHIVPTCSTMSTTTIPTTAPTTTTTMTNNALSNDHSIKAVINTINVIEDNLLTSSLDRTITNASIATIDLLTTNDTLELQTTHGSPRVYNTDFTPTISTCISHELKPLHIPTLEICCDNSTTPSPHHSSSRSHNSDAYTAIESLHSTHTDTSCQEDNNNNDDNFDIPSMLLTSSLFLSPSMNDDLFYGMNYQQSADWSNSSNSSAMCSTYTGMYSAESSNMTKTDIRSRTPSPTTIATTASDVLDSSKKRRRSSSASLSTMKSNEYSKQYYTYTTNPITPFEAENTDLTKKRTRKTKSYSSRSSTSSVATTSTYTTACTDMNSITSTPLADPFILEKNFSKLDSLDSVVTSTHPFPYFTTTSNIATTTTNSSGNADDSLLIKSLYDQVDSLLRIESQDLTQLSNELHVCHGEQQQCITSYPSYTCTTVSTEGNNKLMNENDEMTEFHDFLSYHLLD